MKKLKAPTILYNGAKYKYPNGLRIEDQDDLDIKIESGDWDTGPVDKKNDPPVDATPKVPKVMTIAELIAAARENGMTITEDVDKETIPGAEKETPPEKEKAVDDMTVAELTVVAESKNITILDTWLKADILAAIKAHKE